MKKIILGLALITAGFAVNAQNFNVGLGGGIYSTWLLNKNVFDQGEDLNVAVTFGGQFGLNTQYYFNDKVGLTLGILYTGNSQKYEGNIPGGSVSFEAKTKMRYLDIPLLLRLGGGAKGAYFEVGPQFGILMGAKDELTTTPSDPLSFTPDHWADIDRKNNFKSLNIAIAFGFGVDIEASENVMITTGLRLGYGFTDVTQERPELIRAAKYSLAEEQATDYVYGISTSRAQYNQTGDGDFAKYKSTNRAFGGLFIAVMYKIPTGATKGTPVPETK